MSSDSVPLRWSDDFAIVPILDFFHAVFPALSQSELRRRLRQGALSIDGNVVRGLGSFVVVRGSPDYGMAVVDVDSGVPAQLCVREQDRESA